MSMSITKNRSKQSTASVKFTSKPKPNAPLQAPIHTVPSRQIPRVPLSMIPAKRTSIQNQLTEATFRQYLDGFIGILPKDLPSTMGNRIRYAIDTIDVHGRTVSTQYRLGGWVKSVSPNLSYIILFNPFAKKTWTLRISQPPNKRLRLYFSRRGTSDETAAIRSLATKLQNGQLQIVQR
jgi:hypothetical protein